MATAATASVTAPPPTESKTPAPVAPAVHANVVPLASLLGTWRGTGKGEYPTIKPFEYKEEVTLFHAGKPWIGYSQKTQRVSDGVPLHAESGYWRFTGGNAVEMLISQPSGVQEVALGTWSTSENGSITIKVVANEFTRTPTARPPHVTSIERVFTVTPSSTTNPQSTLSYTMGMATTNTTTMTHHLAATLTKATA